MDNFIGQILLDQRKILLDKLDNLEKLEKLASTFIKPDDQIYMDREVVVEEVEFLINEIDNDVFIDRVVSLHGKECEAIWVAWK